MKKKTAGRPFSGAFPEKLTQAVSVFREREGVLSGIRLSPAVLSAAAVLLAASLAGGVPLPAGIYPFGIAILCAARGLTLTGAAFAGAMLSTLGLREEAFFQIIAILLTLIGRLIACAVTGVFFDKKNTARRLFCESPYIRTALSAGIAAALGVSAVLRGQNLYYALFASGAGMLVQTVVTAAFIMLSSRDRAKRTAGCCAAVFCAVLFLDTLSLPFRLSLSLSYFLTVWCACAGESAAALALGVSCGAALGGNVSLALALTGGIAGMLAEYGEAPAVTAATLCGFLTTGLTGGISAIAEYVPETVFAAAVLLPLIKLKILPKSLIERALGGRDKTGTVFSANAENAAVKERCEKISRALDSLSRLLTSVGDKLRCPTEQESYRICTAARAKYCGGCRFEDLCSGDEFQCVDSFFSNMSHSLALRGKVSARLVPENLARRCYNMDAILTSVNTSAGRLAAMSPAAKRTELIASDYTAIAELLRETALSEADFEADREAAEMLRRRMRESGFDFDSAAVFGKRKRTVHMYGVNCSASAAGERDIRRCAEETLGTKFSPVEFSIDGKTLSASMHTVPSFSVRCGRFSGIGERDVASGDSTVSFENGEGMFYSLVSDGMGSGREAAMTSGLSAVFLEKLLSAGCPMKSALELLNCFVRGKDGECFTTVDLMEADLITGRARFIKSGAAPSFVLRDGRLFRLHSKTVPVGIMRALDAEAISFDLCDGDTVIMLSDGVTGNYEDCPWLYELLCEGLAREDSPSKTAKVIGEAALENTGREDDITVVVMKVTAA